MDKKEKNADERPKNQLRLEYDYAKKHYGGIVTTWKSDFISNAEYQAFIRTYSFVPMEEVPQKFHTAIQILKGMISSHAELVRKYNVKVNRTQLTLPMI